MIRRRMAALILLCGIACASGCGTRTVYVPHGSPVRLRETVRGVKIWAQDKNGEWVPGRLDLPEGWYALPDEKEESEPTE